jgi:hypothetical protein
MLTAAIVISVVAAFGNTVAALLNCAVWLSIMRRSGTHVSILPPREKKEPPYSA